jgi:major structural subunit of bundle-forming pilus
MAHQREKESMIASSMNAMVMSARRKARRGLTLIEAAMVLTILALVVGGVMLYYSNASTSQKVSQVAGQMGSVQQAVRSIYAGQSNYSGLKNSDIAQSLPSSMVDSSGGLHHAFGGLISVVSANVGGGIDSGFSVTLSGLPQEACQKLGAFDLGRSMNAETINGGAVDLPVTPAMVQTACVTGGTNVLSWEFY